MKKMILALGFVLTASTIVACASTSEDNANEFPVGQISQQKLLTEHQSFSDGYQDFELNAEQIAQVKKWPENLSIDVFFGTWCHDSEREVPRLLKITENNGNVLVNLIALDFNKNEPEKRAQQQKIKYTPTFIISLAGKELGRIIEKPNTSLVADINQLIALQNK
jgi:thioredoxin 1